VTGRQAILQSIHKGIEVDPFVQRPEWWCGNMRALIRTAYRMTPAAKYACERRALLYSSVYIVRRSARGELDQHQQRERGGMFHNSTDGPCAKLGYGHGPA
jgi:hypothetical protein